MISNIKWFNLIVTQNCNLNCDFCNIEKKNKNITKKDLSNINKLIKKIINKNIMIQNIKFFGGEPLLNFKVIKKVVKKLHETKYSSQINRLRLTTNGFLLNKQIINFINKYNIRINITLDGRKTTFENNRNIRITKDKRKKLMKNIKYIKDELLFINLTIPPNEVENFYTNLLFILQHTNNINILPVYNNQRTKSQLKVFFKQIKRIKKKKILKDVYLENKENYSPIPLHNRGINIFPDKNIYNCSIPIEQETGKDFKIGQLNKINNITKNLNTLLKIDNYQKKIKKYINSGYNIRGNNKINYYLEKGLQKIMQ